MAVAPIAAPLARMAAIQARFTPPPVAPAAAPAGAPAGAGDFATTLSNVLGAPGGAPVAGPAVADADADAGAEVVRLAETYQGIPYVWGGTDPAKGLDCSGFLQHVFRRVGIDLPRVSRDQARQGIAVPSIDQARPGDLIAFGEPVDHIGIYVGDGKIIHAPSTGDVVKISDIHRTPTAIRRVLPDSSMGVSGGIGGFGAPRGVAGGVASAAASLGGPTMPGSVVASTPALARYAHLFTQAGTRHGVDPNLLAAVAKVESGGNPNAVSPAGASGLMQFMPGTARGMGIDPLDPAQAVDGAARLLSQLRGRLGSVELALAGYNAGEGAVRRHGGIPPFNETRRYVAKVMALTGGAR